jgi:hypothetical protein
MLRSIQRRLTTRSGIPEPLSRLYFAADHGGVIESGLVVYYASV